MHASRAPVAAPFAMVLGCARRPSAESIVIDDGAKGIRLEVSYIASPLMEHGLHFPVSISQ